MTLQSLSKMTWANPVSLSMISRWVSTRRSGWVYLFQTAQQAARAAVDELGVATPLIVLAGQLMHPESAGLALASCLDPFHDRLFEHLPSKVGDGPMLTTGDSQEEAQIFADQWLATLRAASEEA